MKRNLLLHAPLTLAAIAFPYKALAQPEANAPTPAAVDEAEAMLQAGQAKAAIDRLRPPPIAGKGTCVLALALHRQKQPARAMLYLQRCIRVENTSEHRELLAELRSELRRRLLAPVSLSISPESSTATLTGDFANDTLLAEDEVWIPKGSYRLDVQAPGHQDAAFAVEVESSDRMLVPIALEPSKDAGATEIDLGEDAGAELGQVSTTADPRPKSFKTLLAKRYRRAPDPTPVRMEDLRDRGIGPWPFVSTGAGIASLGMGVVFQLREQQTAAIFSYGTGALLTGLGAYLFLRADRKDASPTSRAQVLVGPKQAMVGLTRSF